MPKKSAKKKAKHPKPRRFPLPKRGEVDFIRPDKAAQPQGPDSED